MTAVGELVLVLGLLVSAHCEVRARDPEVEEEEEELGGRAGGAGGGGGGGAAFPHHLPHLDRLHPGPTETPPLGGNYPARSGNWCAFVQKRAVTKAVVCGTEKYTIRSQSPCPSGTPDCQVIMYKLSTRPTYRQKQQILTALLWRCCPGHGGDNCEDIVSGTQLGSGGSDTVRTELHTSGVKEHLNLQHADPNRVQNDHQHAAPVSQLYGTGYQDNQHNTTRPAQDPGHAHNTQDHRHHHRDHQDPRQQQGRHEQLPGVKEHLNLQHADPNRVQNDHQHAAPVSQLYGTGYQDNQHNTTRPAQDPGHAHNTHDHRHHHRDHQDPRQQQGRHEQLPVIEHLVATAPPYPEAPAALPVPHMMALVMSQLQPVLEGFNRSLEHLSRQVGDLARDVAQLKSGQLGAELELRAGPPDGPPVLDEAAEERLDAKLEEVFQQMRGVHRLLETQRMDFENRLHSQHAMLHYNLTSFKTDVDMKLKRHQKMLQVSLQAMNATLAELKLDQDQDQDQDQMAEDEPEEQLPPPPPPPQPSDTSALWEAIDRLDNMVVNNTVKLGGLMEDVDVTSGTVQQLRWDLKELSKQINQTARTSQIQFMETGLEVEAARETVLQRVGELAGNLSQQGERLQEMDVDVDYLYTAIYSHNSTTDCDCKSLKAAVARLERGVANVTELANENRLALEEGGDGGAGQWGGASDWEPAVQAVQHELQQVKDSVSSEQTRIRSLDHSVNQLSGSVKVNLAEVSGLKEADRKLVEEMQHLLSSFNSLLKDAIRHSDVLELLLGEEVLEFLEWPVQDQEANSIPALKEQLRVLQEELRGHNLSITSLLGRRTEDKDEVPSADQPSSSSSSSSSSSHLLPDEWLPGSSRRSRGGVQARERQLLLHPEGRRLQHGGDGSDLWNLEKTVEELQLKLQRLEEKHRNTSEREEAAPPAGEEAKLQAEVTWLKRGLEEHLRVFKNVFSNADVLAASDATLELDKLWQLVKNKDGKKEKKRGGGGGGGHHRSRRDVSGVAPVLSSQSEVSVLLVAGSPLSVSDGVLTLEASLSRGHLYSDTGTFTAPLDGIYLFVLTLDLRPGPAHVVLRRGTGGAPVSLQRQEVTEAGPVTGVGVLPLSAGEEVRLELKGGAWAESEDNVFTVLLLHRTT